MSLGKSRATNQGFLTMKANVSIWIAVLAGLVSLSLIADLRAEDASKPDTAPSVTDLMLASGEKQRVLYLAPPSPRATVVMLPGGAGNLGLALDGTIRHGNNFLVRTRQMWTAKGYAVLIPDWIDRESLRGERSSPEYAAVVRELIQYAQSRASVPVFLIGTSQGSIAAANGAAHALPGSIAGVVLTESVSRLGGSHETVFDAGLSDIRVPALVVANRDDACNVAPPQDAQKIAAAMTHAPEAHVAEVSGGTDRAKRDCDALTPHGYYGIEDKVIGIISDWIGGHMRSTADH